MGKADGPALARQAQAASAFLKTVANDNRLMILCALVEGERNVGELEGLVGLRQSTLSQQLARLREEGFVRTRREGKSIYYRLDRREVVELIGLLHRLFCEPQER